ncbi:MAG: hypothetical protein HY717_22920 [Planctomycetes bacterium]|nr:hypothetical protein [Planctomycetota bacterium]
MISWGCQTYAPRAGGNLGSLLAGALAEAPVSRSMASSFPLPSFQITPGGGYEEYDEIIAREEASQMLHRRFNVEIRGEAFVPINSNLNIGGGVGVKAEMEAFKNLYLGLGFDYIRQLVDETVADMLARFPGDPNAQNEAINADPEQWLESLDRYNILFLYDYDVPLWEGKHPLIFRHGVGLGAVLINGQEVPGGTFAQTPEVRLFTQFLARPSVGFRWPIIDNLLIFVEASFDWVPVQNLTVDGATFTRRAKVDGQVEFSGFNLGGGLTVSW